MAEDFVYPKGWCWGGRGAPRRQPRQVSIMLDMKQEFHLEQGRYCHLSLNDMSLPQVHAHLLKDRRERDEQ